MSKEKYGKSKKRTKSFARDYDVVLTTSKQWMWRRQRQDDGGLQSAIQVLHMTGTKLNFLYAVDLPPVVLLKVSKNCKRWPSDKISVCRRFPLPFWILRRVTAVYSFPNSRSPFPLLVTSLRQVRPVIFRWVLLKLVTGNGERGTGNGRLGTSVQR